MGAPTNAPTNKPTDTPEPTEKPTAEPTEDEICGVYGNLKKKKKKMKLKKKNERNPTSCQCEEACKKKKAGGYVYQRKENKKGRVSSKCFCYKSAKKVKKDPKSKMIVGKL